MLLNRIRWQAVRLAGASGLALVLGAAMTSPAPAQAATTTVSLQTATLPLTWNGTLCANGIAGGGWCQIINAAHDLCLSANPNYDGSNGDAVYLYQCPYSGMSTAQTLAETWTVMATTEGGYHYGEVINYAHNLCLDANASGDGSNGDTVQLWSCWGGVNQLWTPDSPTNSMQFLNVAHYLCLDANASADGSNGDRVQLYSCWGGINQKWGNEYL